MAASFTGLFKPDVIDDRITTLKLKKKDLPEELRKVVEEVLKKDFPEYEYEDLLAKYPVEIHALEESIIEEFIPKIDKKIKHLEILRADIL